MASKGSCTRAMLAVLLLLGAAFQVGAMEQDLKCSACEAVAAELQRRLDAELPKTHLDYRHRLDKDGQRYGKIIDYKVSEIRAVELLEDLCNSMEDYTLLQPAQQDAAKDGDSSSSNSSSSSAEGDTQQEQQQQQQQQAAWVKWRGDGSVRVPQRQRPAKHEEELRVKQLKTFCGMLVENNEEEVVEALVTDQFASAGVAPVLCQQITKRCEGKQYAAAGSSAAAEAAS